MDRGAVLLLGGSGSRYVVDKETCCWWKYLNWGPSAGGIRVRVPDAQRNGCCFRDLNGMVGPDDLDGLFQPRRFCDSVTGGTDKDTLCSGSSPGFPRDGCCHPAARRGAHKERATPASGFTPTATRSAPGPLPASRTAPAGGPGRGRSRGAPRHGGLSRRRWAWSAAPGRPAAA